MINKLHLPSSMNSNILVIEQPDCEKGGGVWKELMNVSKLLLAELHALSPGKLLIHTINMTFKYEWSPVLLVMNIIPYLSHWIYVAVYTS